MNHRSNSFPRRISIIFPALIAVVFTSAAIEMQAQTSQKSKDPFQKVSFESKRSCTVKADGEVTVLVKNGVELSVTEDWDCDGIADAYDNCVGMSNPAQLDKNGNGIGDACEAATDVKTSLPAKPISKEKPKERKTDPKEKEKRIKATKPDRHSRAKSR